MKSCPRCGASNPIENKFCGSCGTPLPTTTPPADDTPPWLHENTPAATTSAPSAGEGAQELPAWLTDLGVEDETPRPTEAAQAPDWLAQLQQDTPSAPQPSVSELPIAPQPAASELPDWLREIEAETSTPAAPASADELPDWLRDTNGSSSAPTAPPSNAQTNALPDWLNESTQPSTQATQPLPVAPSQANDELPSWLHELDQPADAPQEQAATRSTAVDELPDWMQAPTPTSTTGGATAPAADELPPWLRADEAAPATIPEQPQVDALPPWLHNDAAIAGSSPALPDAEHAAESQELSSWLQSEAPAVPSEAPVAQDTPDWLRDESTAPSGTDIDMPVPDWSSEFGAPRSEQQATENELPAWLAEATDDQPVAASTTTNDAPPWLLEESPTAPGASETQPLSAGLQPDDALPAWLKEDTQVTADQPAAATSEGLPSWLSDQAIEAQQPVADQSQNGALDELPAWLRDDTVASMPSEPEDQTPSWLQTSDEPGASAGDQTLPDWLALPDQPDEAGSAQIYNAPAQDDLPAWLQSEDTGAPQQTSLPPASPSSDLPAWLQDQDVTDVDTHTARVYDSPASEASPAWSIADADDDQPGSARIYHTPETHTGSNIAPPPAGADTVDLPAWLSEAQPESDSETTTPRDADLPAWLSGITPEETTSAPQATTKLPTWLDEEAPADTGAKQEAPQSEIVSGLDLPAWLREGTEAPAPTAPATEAAPAWLQRVAPEPEEVAAPIAVEEPAATPRLVRTPERIAAMQMLQQLRDQPAAEPVPQPAAARREWVLPVILLLVAALFIGALLYILLNNRLGLSFGAAPPSTPAAATVVQTIQGLPANRPVLLAYEWNAQRAGEIRPLEEAVLGQLAERTDVPLTFLSTDPQGSLLAGERAEQIRALQDNFHDQYGLGFVNLGFKAGGSLALRRFASNATFGELLAQDAYGNDLRANNVTLQSMCGSAGVEQCTWDNVSLLVVMADEVDDVRGWFEQVRSEHPNLQTLLITPSEIAPQVQPYASLPGVQALAGLSDAEAFFNARGINNESLGRQRDAVAVGGVLFSALVVVGAVPAYISGRRARRRGEEDVWGR